MIADSTAAQSLHVVSTPHYCELPVDAIRVEDRHRSDLGDIRMLADSIDTLGLMLTSVRVERVIPAAEWLRLVEDAGLVEERRRRQVHEAWMRRRAVEAPWFAQLAQQMGLGLALGVAA